MVQLQHSTHPAGEAAMISRPQLAKPECEGEMRSGAARERCLAAPPAGGSLPADSPSRTAFGTEWLLSPACLPQLWPGSRGRECLKDKWMGCWKNNKVTTLQSLRESTGLPQHSALSQVSDTGAGLIKLYANAGKTCHRP